MNAGPGFLFMALEQPAAFIRDGALVCFTGTGAVLAFAALYVWLAPYGGFAVRTGGAVLGWLAFALPAAWLPASLLSALGLILAGGLLVWRARPSETLALQVTTIRAGWGYLLARGLLAGLVIAGIAQSAAVLGPTLTGLAYAFPTTVLASIWVIQRRYGSSFALAAMAGVPGALPSFAGFGLVLYLATGPLPPVGAWALAALASVLVASGRAALTSQRRRAAAIAIPPNAP
jgi:hypothetical protein